MIDLCILDVMLEIVSRVSLSPFESSFEVVQDSCHGISVDKFHLSQNFCVRTARRLRLPNFVSCDSGGAYKKRNIATMEFVFGLSRFFFVLNKLQVIGRPTRERKKKKKKKRANETKFFQDLPWMDKKKVRVEERENVQSRCLLGLCTTCQLLFFHNFHRFQNMNKTFLQ
jgi:beta-lactamase regulating signal transducer with metallopeptidase domain